MNFQDGNLRSGKIKVGVSDVSQPQPEVGPATSINHLLPSDSDHPGQLRLMGIVNITPDSFSDGGKYLAPQNAAEHAVQLVKQGATILDFGAESSRPGATRLNSKQELARLLPALEQVQTELRQTADLPIFPLVSVDTYHAESAVTAIAAGADIINDISAGLYDPEMASAIADLGCPYIAQHLRGYPDTMDQYTDYQGDVVEGVYRELSERTENLLKAGVKSEQIIWDPGLGFAKNSAQNWQLVLAGQRLATAGMPVLLGPSRKRFLGQPPRWLDPKDITQWWSVGEKYRLEKSDQGYQGEPVADPIPVSVDDHPRDILTAQVVKYIADYWPAIWAVRVHQVTLSANMLNLEKGGE